MLPASGQPSCKTLTQSGLVCIFLDSDKAGSDLNVHLTQNLIRNSGPHLMDTRDKGQQGLVLS